jgi:hypothetical protein
MIAMRCNGMVRLCGNIAHDSRFYVGTLRRERGTEHIYPLIDPRELVSPSTARGIEADRTRTLVETQPLHARISFTMEPRPRGRSV